LRRALAKKAEEVQAKIENGDRSKDLRDAGLRFHDKMERKQEAEVLDKEELMGKYREEFEKIKDRKTQRDIKEISEKLTELKELAGRVRADEQIDDAGRDELLKDINDLRKIGLEKWKDIEAEQAQNQPDKPRLSNNDGPSYS
ncbi:MAG: hypothetical protein FWE79_03345, partial [Firmicutes bacterium]|nr:hypothetical protein [Bacillota bacterium]